MFVTGGSDAGAIIAGILSILSLIVLFGLLIICFIPGTKGDNRFDPDPLA